MLSNEEILSKRLKTVLSLHGSILTFKGEYDFSDETLKNSVKFSLPELLEVSAA
jgi:hypothetical protein